MEQNRRQISVHGSKGQHARIHPSGRFPRGCRVMRPSRGDPQTKFAECRCAEDRARGAQQRMK